jgi:hypothetical protein
MHASIMGGPMGEMVFFLQGQGIEIGSQANAARAIAVAQDTDHPCSGNTGMHLDAPLAQSIGHQGGGSVLFKTQFGMGVNVSTQNHKGAHVFKIWQMEHGKPQ